MIFIYLMKWLHLWYDEVVFPIILMPYTYVLLSLWMVIMAIIMYLFFYKVDRDRMQYLYKNFGVALFKSAGYGLIMVTLSIALYNVALSLTAQSDFFTLYRPAIINLEWGVSASNLIALRIFTVLFLMFSSLLCEKFIADYSYQLEDPKVKWVFSGCIALGSIVCYLLCMYFGYV